MTTWHSLVENEFLKHQGDCQQSNASRAQFLQFLGLQLTHSDAVGCAGPGGIAAVPARRWSPLQGLLPERRMMTVESKVESLGKVSGTAGGPRGQHQKRNMTLSHEEGIVAVSPSSCD